MRIGIDVGGTHTDAVVMDQGEVRASCKMATRHDDLLASVREALGAVLTDVDPAQVARLNLSTTLSTNAIVQSKVDEVGVLVAAGPGVDPEDTRIGRAFFVIPGSIDHRGVEAAPLDEAALDAAVAACRDMGLSAFACVGKFSTRNPAHEQFMRERLGDMAEVVSLGHRMSGVLNFPRRVSTAYYNSAVWRLYNAFADAMEKSAKEYGLTCPVNVLKADGGTMPLAMSRERPVESILSGPAASVMGMSGLCGLTEDCIVLDIGGTTTDIAVFADGRPVIETEGIEVGSYKTLVRALATRSIGIGGDSRLRINAGEVRVGPERDGPAMAFGGAKATLLDAMNYLRITSAGDVDASIRGIKQLAGLWDQLPEPVAEQAVDKAVTAIRDAAEDMVWSINQRPVYTIGELLRGEAVRPVRVYVMGGPAQGFQKLLAKAFDKDVVLPPHFDVANAIGAAMTRTTWRADLFADTAAGRMLIPDLGVEQAIDRSYNLENAKADAAEHLASYMAKLGFADRAQDLDVIEAQSFSMVDYAGLAGRNIRVRCQVRPGVAR